MPRSEFLLKLRRALRLDLALRFVWQSTPRWTLANVALVVIQAPLPLLSLYLMKLLVDRATGAVGSGDVSGAFGDVAVVVVAMGAVSLLTVFLSQIADLVNQAQSLTLTDHVNDVIHAKSLEVDLAYYENAEYYNTLRRAQQQGTYRPLSILRGLTQLGQNGLSLTAIAALLLSFHPAVPLVLLAAVVPTFLVRVRYSGKMYAWNRRRTETERRSWYYNFLLTGEGSAKEVRLFSLGPLLASRYRDLRAQLRFEQLRLARWQAVRSLLAQITSVVAIYGALIFIAYRAVQGDISLGDLVMYYQAFQRGQSYLQGVLSNLASLYDDNLFLTDLYEFLDLTPHVVPPAHPAPVPRPMRQGITFEGVSFTYPDSSRPTLHDVSLTIRTGEKVALVGENGSGKTTLIKLLCRLYDPDAGCIQVDGTDLRALDLTAWRREVSVIMQDYVHYNLTARENIWFGNVEAPPDEERIITVAQNAGAHEPIARLRQGYATVLGRMFEEGEQLSIGEWQKVALARALLREAQLVILDEPTSAVDAAAEYEILRNLRQFTADRAVITISHRFSSVRGADTIYVLDQGRIVERGTHDALMALDGKYASLFRKQAESYLS